MAQVIEGMPSNHKALSSHPSTHIHTPKKKNKPKKKPRRQLPSDNESPHLKLELPASRTVRNKGLFLKPPKL
jgi:hypothetical protein